MAEEKKLTQLGLPENTTAALAYLLGWVTGLIVFLVEKENQFVRFHAMQSIIFFGMATLVSFIPFVGWVLSPFVFLLSLVVWIFCLVKAYQGEEFELPVVGAFAKKQLKKTK